MGQCQHRGYDGQCTRRATRPSGMCWQHDHAATVCDLAAARADAERMAAACRSLEAEIDAALAAHDKLVKESTR